MIPACYCQDLQASALWICSMYLFTQPIYLPHYFPVCLRRGCLFSLSLSLPVSPSLLLSFSHPRHPPSSLSLLTDSLSQTHAHTHTHATHTHTQRHMLCLTGSEPLTTVCLQKSSFILHSLDHNSKARLLFAGVQTCPGILPIRDSLLYDGAF